MTERLQRVAKLDEDVRIGRGALLTSVDDGHVRNKNVRRRDLCKDGGNDVWSARNTLGVAVNHWLYRDAFITFDCGDCRLKAFLDESSIARVGKIRLPRIEYDLFHVAVAKPVRERWGPYVEVIFACICERTNTQGSPNGY